MSINCHEAKRWSTAYVDGRLRSEKRSGVAQHLAGCDSCSNHFEQLELIRTALGEMRSPAIPKELQTALKVIASKERAEVVRTRGSRFQAIWGNWKFRMRELMRPVALPATGGLLSALLLFGTFIFTIGTTTRIVTYEIPLTGWSAETNLVPVELRSHLVILNMSFDGNGRIGEYAVSDPSSTFTAGLQTHPASIRVPDFPTVFAVSQPVTGDIQIKFEPIAFRQ
jgi:hypothetical protein